MMATASVLFEPDQSFKLLSHKHDISVVENICLGYLGDTVSMQTCRRAETQSYSLEKMTVPILKNYISSWNRKEKNRDDKTSKASQYGSVCNLKKPKEESRPVLLVASWKKAARHTKRETEKKLYWAVSGWVNVKKTPSLHKRSVIKIPSHEGWK